MTEQKKLNRFNLGEDTYWGGSMMRHNDDGEFILYADHERIVTEMQTRLDNYRRNLCRATATTSI